MAEEDIVFGKNRHFFGGIEPSNLKTFSVTEANDVDHYDKINVVLPDDTVVNGQTLCTVAGAVIRYATDHFPTNEFDGVLVADVKNSGMIACPVDPDSTALYVRYYAAFPYTTQGVYNRNVANRYCVNESDALESMLATPVYDSATGSLGIELAWVFGSDSNGVEIYKSTVGYLDSNDSKEISDKKAVLIVDCQRDTTITSYIDTDDTIVAGQTYYYTAFPSYSYSVASPTRYNFTSNVGRVSCIPGVGRTYLFGYDLDLSDENPATRVSYPADVDNASYQAVYQFTIPTTGQPISVELGDWGIAPGEKFMPRPCVLGFDGVVKYYLNPDNYLEKEDGSSSGITDSSLDGNVMIEWPKIYTKRWEENGVYHFRCSDAKLDSAYDCWCNYDKNDNVIDHFYTAAYLGYKDDSNRIRSISGVYPYRDGTTDNYVNYAKNNGEDWYTEVLADRLLIQDLLVMMGKSTEPDGAYTFGPGLVSSPTLQSTGGTDNYGMFHGSGSDSGEAIKVFGMEHWWGNLYRYCAGYVFDTGSGSTDTPYRLFLKITRGTHDGSTATDYSNDGEGYFICDDLDSQGSLYDTKLGDVKYKTKQNGSKAYSGYIYELHTTPYGRVFDVYAAVYASISGSSSTYYPDGYTVVLEKEGGATYSLGKTPAFVGGHYNNGSIAGPFATSFNTKNAYGYSLCGVALSCKPSASN